MYRRMLSALLLLTPAIVVAQTPSEPPPGESAPQSIVTETLTAPKLVNMDTGGFPPLEANRDHEGWVELEFMVDARGKPFEVAVVNSSGNKAFEKAAANAVAAARFQAGTLNGQPVESASKMTVDFVIAHGPRGADAEFFAADRVFLKAVNAKDRPAADAAFTTLVVQNLYDDAYYGLAQYMYARNWGSQEEQLAGLRRAIAGQHRFEFLKVRDYRATLIECIRLEASLHKYSEAMKDWDELKKSGVDAPTANTVKPAIDLISALRSNAESYDVDGTLTDGSWHVGLFKTHFRIAVSDGHAPVISLHCKKGYLRFTYDAALLYTVPPRYGDCELVLEGDPGSRITLTQS